MILVYTLIVALLWVGLIGLLVWLANRTGYRPHPVYSCEICGARGVRRVANWDYCPAGHTYVGHRADGVET